MRAGKIVAVVAGSLMALVGLALVAPGAFLLWAYGTQRDSSGFFETSSRTVATRGYALTTPAMSIHMEPVTDWLPTGGAAAVRIRATSTGSAPVFIGLGPSDQVSRYLGNVAHDEVTNFDFGWWWGELDYRHQRGADRPAVPGGQDFWAAQQQGSGGQTLEWDIRDGDWTAVIMNADAAAPVTAEVSLGARFGLLLPISIGLLAGGVVLLAVGVLLIVRGARRSRPERVSPSSPPAPSSSPPPEESR